MGGIRRIPSTWNIMKLVLGLKGHILLGYNAHRGRLEGYMLLDFNANCVRLRGDTCYLDYNANHRLKGDLLSYLGGA